MIRYGAPVLHNIVTTTSGEYSGGKVVSLEDDSVSVAISNDGTQTLNATGTWTDGSDDNKKVEFTFYFNDAFLVFKHRGKVIE